MLMRRLVASVLMFFLLPASAGQMEVFQCVDERGRMGLSDRPCEDLDPTFQFVNMREVQTYGTPRSSAAPATQAGAGRTPGQPTGQQQSALPEADPDCIPANPDDPWLNRIGEDDCKKPE